MQLSESTQFHPRDTAGENQNHAGHHKHSEPDRVTAQRTLRGGDSCVPGAQHGAGTEEDVRVKCGSGESTPRRGRGSREDEQRPEVGGGVDAAGQCLPASETTAQRGVQRSEKRHPVLCWPADQESGAPRRSRGARVTPPGPAGDKPGPERCSLALHRCQAPAHTRSPCPSARGQRVAWDWQGAGPATAQRFRDSCSWVASGEPGPSPHPEGAEVLLAWGCQD